MKFQLITWLLFPIINLELVTSCEDYGFECPWDGDSFKIYTKWSWSKFRCVMSTTQNINKRMKEKCQNLGTCDDSTTWYDNVQMGCSVPEKWIKTSTEQGKITLPSLIAYVFPTEKYDAFFNDACVMHDICYRSSNTKLKCDDEFLLNMVSMCAYVFRSPQTRYKKVTPLEINHSCKLWAGIFWLAVNNSKGAKAAYNRQQEFHKDHCLSDVASISSLINEERKVDIKTLNGLIDQQKRDFESYNNNNYNPNNEPMAVLNDMEWKMNILIAF
eukprot:360779_1